MPKVTAMIPVRLGSKRIKYKNLRLLGQKPLVGHVLETAQKSGVFEEIYLNSEAEVFCDVAKEYGVKFYKRSDELASNEATNDQFVYDFLQNVNCDILIQINCTSPFYTVEDIKNFTQTILDNDYDVLHGVKEERIASIFKGKAINFDFCKQMPRSQDLEPVLVHAGGIMGWKKDKYFENMQNYNCGVYGCKSKIGYFKLSGFSKIDIDYEEDFALAEAIILMKAKDKVTDKKYYKKI